MEPSVKGGLVVGAVVAVRRHRDAGRVSEEQLVARLGPAALDLIDRKIDIARWYPFDAFSELTDLDWDVAGRRDPDYMRHMGEVSAARLFKSGIYHQLDYVERAQRVENRRSLVRQAKLITTITNALYNFLEINVRVERECLEIVYGNAALYSEGLRYTTEGFMNEINARQGASRRWTSERPAPDRIVFRLLLPKRLHAEA